LKGNGFLFVKGGETWGVFKKALRLEGMSLNLQVPGNEGMTKGLGGAGAGEPMQDTIETKKGKSI